MNAHHFDREPSAQRRGWLILSLGAILSRPGASSSTHQRVSSGPPDKFSPVKLEGCVSWICTVARAIRRRRALPACRRGLGIDDGERKWTRDPNQICDLSPMFRDEDESGSGWVRVVGWVGEGDAKMRGDGAGPRFGLTRGVWRCKPVNHRAHHMSLDLDLDFGALRGCAATPSFLVSGSGSHC
jgi:hypothetical protein